jgi:hypothetical protein
MLIELNQFEKLVFILSPKKYLLNDGILMDTLIKSNRSLTGFLQELTDAPHSHP